MKSNIYIPKRLNVGYQNREDTYTGKIAYVIYYDEKYSLQGTTQSRYLTGGVPPVRFSM